MSEVLERGEIGFVYRPRVERAAARGIEDVQQFFLILAPRGRAIVRRIRVGRKRLPDIGRRQRFWGYVDRTAVSVGELVADLQGERYWTRTRGLRFQPGPRLAAAGAYALARHEDHVHLAYALAPPARAGLQQDLGIAPEASYILGVFARSLPPRFAGDLGARRYAPASPEVLDLPGTEIVLIGAAGGVEEELGLALDRAAETAERSSLLDDLRRERDRPAELPLFDRL